VKAKLDNDVDHSADSDTSTVEESGDDAAAGTDLKVDGDSTAGDDEEVWEELQREARKENILETKSKETHPVHCPYFPSVRRNFSAVCSSLEFGIVERAVSVPSGVS